MLRPRQELRVLSRKKGEEQFTIVKLLLSNKETNRCDHFIDTKQGLKILFFARKRVFRDYFLFFKWSGCAQNSEC